MYTDYFSLFVILFVSFVFGYIVFRSDVFFWVLKTKNMKIKVAKTRDS